MPSLLESLQPYLADAPPVTAPPEPEDEREDVREASAPKSPFLASLDQEMSGGPEEPQEPPEDPAAVAARERIAAMKAAGDEQWQQIEESQEGDLNPLAEAMRKTRGELGERLVQGVGQVAGGAQGALQAGASGVEQYGQRLQRQGEKRSEALGDRSLMEPVGEAVEEAGFELGRMVDRSRQPSPQQTEVEVTPHVSDEDFWKGMKEDPLRTLALQGTVQIPQLVATLGAAGAAGMAGGAGVGFLQEAGAAHNQAIEEGATEEQAVQAAGMTGAANMFLEYLPAGLALKRLAGPARGEAVGLVKDVIKQAASEGLTESMQELNSILMASLTYAEDHEWSWDDAKQAGASGLLGAVVGGPVGAATSVAARQGDTLPSTDDRTTTEQETSDEQGIRQPPLPDRENVQDEPGQDAQPDQERRPGPREQPQREPQRSEAGQQQQEVESAVPPAAEAEASSPPPSTPPPVETRTGPGEGEVVEPAEGEIQFVDDEGGAMEHAGSAVSPEAISRQQGGTRFYEVSPSGETTPIIGPEAVDQAPRRGYTKVRLSPNGEAVVEAGTLNRVQREAVDRLTVSRETPQEATTAPETAQETPTQEPAPPAATQAQEEAVEAAPRPVVEPSARGKEGKAFTSRETEVPFDYALVDAADLVASHSTALQANPDYPAALQPRQRGRAASREQVESIANKLQPERLGESASAATGAPIVGQDLVVESGNARSIALRRAYDEGKAEDYRGFLRDNADRFGLTAEDVARVERPVLVRIRKGEADRAELAREMNESDVATMSATEQAQADAKRLTPEILEGLQPTESGEISMANSRDFIVGFQERVVPQSERGGMVDEKGFLSQQGRQRIQNAVFLAAYGDAGVAARLIEAEDNNIKNVGRALLREAPRMVRLQQAMKSGGRREDLDIAPDLLAAVRKLDALRQEGTKVDDYLAQGELLGPELTPEARSILETLGGPLTRSSKRIADVLRRYQELVDEAGDPRQIRLVGTEAPATRTALWEEAVKTYEKAGQQDLFSEDRERLAARTPETPGGTRGSRAPGWLASEAETKAGSKLVEAIRKDPGGRKAGLRSIGDFLVEATRAELRVGTEQTSRRSPAHYEVSPHVIRSRAGNNLDYVGHEVGHALSAVIRDKNPKAFNAAKGDLKALTERDGSLASGKNAEEGLAEWVRLSVVDPSAVADLPVTEKIEAVLREAAPETLEALRDAARAYQSHLGRQLFSRFRSHSRTRPTPTALGSQIRDAWHRVLFLAAARRSAIDRMDRNVWRAALKAAKRGEVDRHTAQRSVRRFLNKIKDTEADLRSAYQSVLHGTQEVEGALLGRGKRERQGLRIRKTGEGVMLDDDAVAALREAGLPVPDAGGVRHGDWLYLTDMSAQDIVERLGNQWEDFETYAQARVALDRFETKEHQYPGWPHDPTPEDLRKLVEDGNAREGFNEAFKDFQRYADGLLSVGVLGGLVDPKDAVRMKKAYTDYLPLIREQERELGFRGGGESARPSPGFHRASGGQQPFLPLLDALELRTNQVLGAYYANRAVLAPIKAAEVAAKDTGLPKDVRDVVSRVATKLKLDTESVAKLTPDEARKIIADHLNSQKAEADETIKPEDIDIHWNAWEVWRAVEPKAIRIVAPVINGKRAFYQVEDPILYDLFAHTGGEGGRASEIFDLFSRWAVGMRRPWKRVLTQNAVFAFRNVGRDSITGNFFGEGPESFIPAFFSLGGLVRQLTGRTPEGSTAGEMLSRAFETTHSPAHRARVGKFQEILREGIIPDDWRRLSMPQKIMELAGPIPMAAVMKPVELGLWATGQRYIAQLTEEASRLEAYAQTLKRGGSHEAAQQAYDYVTGNFGDQPASHFLSQLYRIPGFVNPAIQITYELGNRLSHPDPKVRAAHWVKAAPWLMLMTAIGWGINRLITPDEREKELEERPDEDRMSYMAIGGYLRVPFDYGLLGAVQSWTWNTLDTMAGHGPRGKIMSRLLLRRATDLPIGGPMSFMQPQLKALLENEANYKWYWADEIEPHWMKYLPPEDRAYWSTPKVYRFIAKHMGVGPLKIQHFVQAGMAYQLDETVRWLDRLERGERIEEPADVPFVGRLIQRSPRGWGSASVKEIADLDQQYKAAKDRLEAVIDDESSSDEAVKAAETQLDSLEAFHYGMLDISDLWKEAKEMRQGGNAAGAREKEQGMVEAAAKVLREAAEGAKRAEQEEEEAEDAA